MILHGDALPDDYTGSTSSALVTYQSPDGFGSGNPGDGFSAQFTCVPPPPPPPPPPPRPPPPPPPYSSNRPPPPPTGTRYSAGSGCSTGSDCLSGNCALDEYFTKVCTGDSDGHSPPAASPAGVEEAAEEEDSCKECLDPRGCEDSDFVTIITVLSPFVHVLALPFFMKKKAKHSVLEKQLSGSVQPSQVMDDDAKTRIFAIKFTLCQSIFIFFVGNAISLVGFIIKIVKLCGLGKE